MLTKYIYDKIFRFIEYQVQSFKFINVNVCGRPFLHTNSERHSICLAHKTNVRVRELNLNDACTESRHVILSDTLDAQRLCLVIEILLQYP